LVTVSLYPLVPGLLLVPAVVLAVSLLSSLLLLPSVGFGAGAQLLARQLLALRFFSLLPFFFF